MKTKLENRLLQYEKNRPVSNDAELLKALEAVISEEEALPYEERDLDLIDEAVEAILYLQNIDTEQLEKKAEEITEKYLKKTKNEKMHTESPAKRSVRLKWLIPVAAVMAVFIAGTAVSYSFGHGLMELYKKSFMQLAEKVFYKEGDNELIVSWNQKEYDSLEELTENEKDLNAMLPYDLPKGCRIDSISVVDYGAYKEISLSISDEETTIGMTIETPYTDVFVGSDEHKHTVGDRTVFYYQYDGKHQFEFADGKCCYSIVSSSYDSSETVLKSLEDIK